MSIRNTVLPFALFFGLTFACAAHGAPDLYGTVSPSVVYLEHEIYIDPTSSHNADLWQRFERIVKHPFLSTYFPIASGSGFFIDDQGHALTNRHVVSVEDLATLRRQIEAGFSKWLDHSLADQFSSSERDALKADIVRLFEGGRYRFAAMVGNRFVGEVHVLSTAGKDDPDLALVQAGSSSTPSLLLASEAEMGTVLIGQDVFSLGYPLGFELDTLFKERVVTMNKGIISAYRESESLDIQHSAAISHGNSGGPLVDARGQVVGINSATLQESQGNSLFYAIGADKVRQFLTRVGYAQMIAWNERLAHMGEQAIGLRANAQGELETSASLLVDVADATSIKVDGVEQGPGPRTLALSSALSTLEITDASGTFTAKLRLSPRMQGQSTLKLLRRGALVTVSFSSDPSGASVSADGRLLGSTPLQVSLPAGDYAITCQLSGYVFEDSTLHLQPGGPAQLALDGRRTYAVSLKVREDLSKASATFRSGSRDHRFEHVDAILLPSGNYILTVAGIEGLEGVSIPVQVGDGPIQVDLETAKKKADLLVRGLGSKASLWIDGERQPDACPNPLLVSVGLHTVAIWEDGRMPLEPVGVHVKSDNSSVIIWNAAPGKDAWSTVFFWSGVGAGVAGTALAAVGFYFDSDAVAVASTTSYAGYTSMKNLAGAAVVAGLGLIGVAAVSEVVALLEKKDFERQRRVFSNMARQ